METELRSFQRIGGRIAQALHRLPYFPGQWRIARLIGRAPFGGNIIVRDEQGISYLAADGNVTGHILLTQGSVEPEIAAMVPSGSDIVIDVGCNIGTFALPASRHARRVIAIDANEALCDGLRESCRLNGIDNITVIHTAISDSPENTISFYRARAETSVSSLIESHVDRYDSYDRIVVPNTRLESVIAALDGSIDVLKIDAEGVTGAVISSLGAGASRVKKIIAEDSEDLATLDCAAVLDDYDRGQPLADRNDLADHTRYTIVAVRRA